MKKGEIRFGLEKLIVFILLILFMLMIYIVIIKGGLNLVK